ncbi:MAG: acetyl-CoA hydrolase/transferase C-terminal domain-containing protein [Nitrososphaerota archaeon]
MDDLRIPPSLEHLVVEPEDVLKHIPKSGVVAFGGMAGTALAKEVPAAISHGNGDYRLTLLTGGTTTSLFEEGLSSIQVGRRYPVASGKTSRDMANSGALCVADYWLSEYSRLIRCGGIPQARKIDTLFIESTGVAQNGVVPSLSIDAVPAMVEAAEKVVVEVNLSKPMMYGLHDVYLPRNDEPVPIKNVLDRVGEPVVRCPWKKIAAIIVTDKPESGAGAYGGVGSVEFSIAGHVTEILGEIVGGQQLRSSHTLQPGAGPLASALLHKLDLGGTRVWSEAITVDWVHSIGGQVDAVSTSCIYTLRGQEKILEKVYDELASLKDSLVLRPYEITNRAEIISRMNLISIQQAIEVDIYGNTNITHIGGDIYNGVGGSGDFTRNAFLTVLALPSTASEGKFSRIVPICSHVDIPEHDVDFLVTENGWADLRGLSPRERARVIIANCVHDKFRDALADYFEKACMVGGHEPVSWKDALEFRHITEHGG